MFPTVFCIKRTKLYIILVFANVFDGDLAHHRDLAHFRDACI